MVLSGCYHGARISTPLIVCFSGPPWLYIHAAGIPQTGSVTKTMLTAQEARLAKAARSFAFDTSLAPYNLGTLQQWRSLSGHITRELIEKVAPVNGGNLSVTTEPDPFLKGPRTAAEEQLAAQLQSKAHVGSQAGQAGSGQAGAGSERSDLQAPEQAHLGSHTGQPAASSGQESAAPYQAGKSPVAGQPAESISRESRDSCTPEGAGSAAATNTRQPATQTQKGVGRCFYTPVPTRATVRRCISKLAYAQITDDFPRQSC